MEYIILAINAILVKNILLAQYLGNCPFLGVSKKMETATGMGMAVIFVMTFATSITWFVHHYILVTLQIEYLQTIVFILVIAALVQLIEMFLKKLAPALYKALGIFLPLITTNCAVLGIALLNVQRSRSLTEALAYGLGGGLGFSLVIALFAGLRERTEAADVPQAFRGAAISLVTAAFMALGFMGFAGMASG